MGSAIALAVSLSMSAIVFLFLRHDYPERLAGEQLTLLKGLLWSWSFTIVGVLAFYGEQRQRSWRRAPQLLLGAGCLLLVYRYWPS
jgi:hypothetical protein